MVKHWTEYGTAATTTECRWFEEPIGIDSKTTLNETQTARAVPHTRKHTYTRTNKHRAHARWHGRARVRIYSSGHTHIRGSEHTHAQPLTAARLCTHAHAHTLLGVVVEWGVLTHTHKTVLRLDGGGGGFCFFSNAAAAVVCASGRPFGVVNQAGRPAGCRLVQCVQLSRWNYSSTLSSL